MSTWSQRGVLLLITTLLSCSSNNGPAGGTIVGAGSSAKDYLSAQTYSSLIVEIQAVSGYRPSATTQSNLVSFLQARLNKPGGITVQVDADIASPGQSSYSLSAVQAVESANRKLQAGGSQAVAYFLFLDGASTSDSSSGSILGIAHGASSVVIFEKTIQSLAGGIGQPSLAVLESTVSEHEFGHLLGLTNVGSPMQTDHQDSAHGKHCSVTSCLMYWQVDTSNFVGNLLGGSIPQLDPDCLADLQAAGGK